MTPGERDRRIEAAARELYAIENSEEQRHYESDPAAFRLGRPKPDPFEEWAEEYVGRATRMLNAADEAVPVVPATWDGLLEHLDAMYPAAVFSGKSGDLGARLVALARRLAEAESKLAEVESAARAVLPLLGMGPVSEFSTEPYGVKARLALVLDESDNPSRSGEAEMQRRSRIDHEAAGREHARAERAEAAARDFASALQAIVVSGCIDEVIVARDVLARHPSFSGKEGTESRPSESERS